MYSTIEILSNIIENGYSITIVPEPEEEVKVSISKGNLQKTKTGDDVVEVLNKVVSSLPDWYMIME